MSEFARLALQPASRRSTACRYGVACFAVIAATGLRLAANPLMGLYAPHLTFTFAVMFAAWFGGRGPGLAATALSTFSVFYFFTEPVFTFRIADPKVIWGLALFAVVGTLISLLAGSVREEHVELEHIRNLLAEGQRIAHLGTWEYVADTGTTVWSEEEYRIFGLDPSGPSPAYDVMLAKSLRPDDAALLDQTFMADLQNRSIFELEHRIVRPDGSVRWIYDRAHPYFDQNGHLVRYIGTTLDITERKSMEDQIRQAQKLESIGLLAGGVAHDFNNLLTVIMGIASAGLQECPSSQPYQNIISASERAAHLTRQLLAYAGKGHFVIETLDLNDRVSRMLDLLSASIPKRVRLSFNPSEKELPIDADPSQIEQILMNLVINASEAIPPQSHGCVEIATSSREVTPEIARRQAPSFDVKPGRFVCLEVTDNGTGMDKATVAQVFDPFFSTKFQGRGLGLAAVQGIVRTRKGFIDVQSFLGAGSKFKVFLPAVTRRAAEAVVSQPGLARPEVRETAAILVVDDEEMVRKMASTALRNRGYEVLEAQDGRDALELLAGGGPPPSLILLDLAMPVMGGDELVPVLNRNYPGLKILLTSGYPEHEAQEGLPLGAVAGFLQKPYTVLALAQKVEEILKQSRRIIEFPRAG